MLKDMYLAQKSNLAKSFFNMEKALKWRPCFMVDLETNYGSLMDDFK
jgi:hypothetical protein